MAVLQRIMQRDDLAEILSALKDIDPQVITAAEEEKRKQAALTSAEVEKSTQARAYLSQYDNAVLDIENREIALKSGNIELNEKYLAYNEFAKKEDSRFAEWDVNLNEREKQHDSAVQSHAENVSHLENRKKELENLHKSRMSGLEAIAAKNEAVRKENEAESMRLAKLAEELKTKAEAARTLMAAF